jgi:hypothetical protein
LDVFAFSLSLGTGTVFTLPCKLDNFRICVNQCFGSESGSGFNQVCGSVSGLGIRIQGKGAKMTQKSRKKLRNFMF